MTNRCAQRECDTTEDCLRRKPSPTVQCPQGFCVDPTWGCIGQPDDRTRTPGETGTLQVQLLTSDEKPIAGADWQIKVCSPPQFDQDCASPLVGPYAAYDAETGIATISGLSYEMPVRLMFDERARRTRSAAPPYIPIDFFTQRPRRGRHRRRRSRVVERKYSETPGRSFNNVPTPDGGKAVDDTLGNIYGRLFDCENKPAGNVQLSYANALGMPLAKEPIVLFFDEQNVPSLTRKWSFPTGVFSSLNIPLENINVATTLIVDPNSTPPVKTRSIRSEYTLRLASQRMTTVHFYPRNYSK